MTKIFGHRGAKAYYAENTLLSFHKAFDQGSDGLELDVHFSKDGELIVFHDFTMERMTKKRGYVFQYTLRELKEMQVYFKDQKEKIPTLSEVLDLIKDRQKKEEKKLLLNVELKAGSIQYPQIEEKVMNLCAKYLPLEQVIFSSFDHYALTEIKKIDSKAQIGVLTAALLYEPWEYAKSLNANFYHPNYLTLNQSSIKNFFEHGIGLNPYTVNDLEIAKQLIQSNVYGLITDIPDKIVALK